MYKFYTIIKEYHKNKKLIPDKMYCKTCGLLKCSRKTSHDLEEYFLNIGQGSGPIYVDYCQCKKMAP